MTPTKKPLPKKVPTKKTATKKAVTKKVPAKKTVAKKVPAKKTVAKKEEKKKTTVKKERRLLAKQNGVVRPASGGKTAVIWEIADELRKQNKGACPKRADVLALAAEHGSNLNMANCQFQSWRTFYGFKK